MTLGEEARDAYKSRGAVGYQHNVVEKCARRKATLAANNAHRTIPHYTTSSLKQGAASVQGVRPSQLQKEQVYRTSQLSDERGSPVRLPSSPRATRTSGSGYMGADEYEPDRHAFHEQDHRFQHTPKHGTPAQMEMWEAMEDPNYLRDLDFFRFAPSSLNNVVRPARASSGITAESATTRRSSWDVVSDNSYGLHSVSTPASSVSGAGMTTSSSLFVL